MFERYRLHWNSKACFTLDVIVALLKWIKASFGPFLKTAMHIIRQNYAAWQQQFKSRPLTHPKCKELTCNVLPATHQHGMPKAEGRYCCIRIIRRPEVIAISYVSVSLPSSSGLRNRDGKNKTVRPSLLLPGRALSEDFLSSFARSQILHLSAHDKASRRLDHSKETIHSFCLRKTKHIRTLKHKTILLPFRSSIIRSHSGYGASASWTAIHRLRKVVSVEMHGAPDTVYISGTVKASGLHKT